MKKLHEMWLRLPLNYQKEIVSFTHTFLGVFGSIVILGIAVIKASIMAKPVSSIEYRPYR
jgi:hypothetical protein